MARPGPAAGFDKILHPQKRAALLAYAETMRVDQAMQTAKITRTHHYYWLKTDPDYKAAFDEARLMAADRLEAEAVRRGMGYLEPIYNEQGEHVGMAPKHSDTLLIFLLKGARPDLYKERYEHTGKDGGPIQVASMAPDARQARLAALLAKRNGDAPAVTPEPGSAS